jgi:Tfp pilus assembly protein PilN
LIRINLLPRVPRRRLPGRQFIEIGIPAVTLVIVIILGLLMAARNSGLQRQIADVQTAIAEIKPTVDRVLELDRQIAEMRSKETVITELLAQQLPASSVLNEMRLLIPRDVWLTSLSVPEPSALNIEGFGLTYPSVAQLMDNLSTGQLFRTVDLTVAQTERVGGREVVKFSVTARVQKPQAAGGSRP